MSSSLDSKLPSDTSSEKEKEFLEPTATNREFVTEPVKSTDYDANQDGGYCNDSERDYVGTPWTKSIQRLVGVSSLGGLLFGYESGAISVYLLYDSFLPRHRDFDSELHSLSSSIKGLVVSVFCIGCLLGAGTGGWTCDRFGRKRTIVASAICYVIGVSLQIIPFPGQMHFAQYAAGRVVTGLGVGALSLAVPMYIVECVSKKIRGQATACFQLMIAVGFLLAALLNWGMSKAFADEKHQYSSAKWRIPNSIAAIFGLLLAILGQWCLHESPIYDFRKDHNNARRTLAIFIACPEDTTVINLKIKELEDEEKKQAQEPTITWRDMFSNNMLHRTLLGIGLQIGQQLTGCNLFFYYGATIFEQAGLGDPFKIPIFICAVNLAGSLISLWVVKLVDRKMAFRIGSATMIICLFVFAILGTFVDRRSNSSNPLQGGFLILVVFTCINILAFAASWGPLVWTCLTEMYPPKHRAKGSSIATAANWLTNFVISFATPSIVGKIGYLYGLVFAGSLILLWIMIELFMIETRDVSLAEIDRLYLVCKLPVGRKSPIVNDGYQTGVTGGDNNA